MSESQTPYNPTFSDGSPIFPNRDPNAEIERLQSELTATRARLTELEGIAERLYEQQNYQHPNTRLGCVSKVMADYEAYKEGKK